MAQTDPYRGYRFRVEFDGVQQGGFSRVKGLMRETRHESYREGGVNDYEHKLASLTAYGPLVLERGLADTTLWDWHDDVVGGTIQRKKISVILMDETGEEVWRWHADDAFPVKWSVGDLDASASQVTVESVEFAHQGLRQG
jgi:phage tail-like protein